MTATNTSNRPQLNSRQLAERLGVKPETPGFWRRNGSGPPYNKIGKIVRYDQDQLDAWLAGQARTSTRDGGDACAR